MKGVIGSGIIGMLLGLMGFQVLIAGAISWTNILIVFGFVTLWNLLITD